MSIQSRVIGLIKKFDQSRRFVPLGRPLLWYFVFHYRWRLASWQRSEPREEIIELTYRGQKLRFALTPVYGGVLTGIFLEEEYYIKEALRTPPRTILDLGANAGMAAGAFHAQFSEAELILVEPDPRNVQRLKSAVTWNGMNATILPVAVSDEPGMLQLRIGDNPTCSALETSTMHNLPEMIEVEVRTVIDILDQAGWSKVDLVKIDIEGMEENVVCGGRSWLDRANAVILEIHPSCDVERIRAAFEGAGFQFERHGSGHEPVYLAQRD